MMPKMKDLEVNLKVNIEPEVVVEEKPVGKPQRFWNGIAVLDCPDPACKFDALYEKELEDHIRRAHSLPPAETPSRIVLADRYGNVKE